MRNSYRIKLLLAWKKHAEKHNNTWAVQTASKHILELQKRSK